MTVQLSVLSTQVLNLLDPLSLMMDLSRYVYALMLLSLERDFSFDLIHFGRLTDLLQRNTVIGQLLRKLFGQPHRLSLQINQFSHVSLMPVLPPEFEFLKRNLSISVAVKILNDAFKFTIRYF